MSERIDLAALADGLDTAAVLIGEAAHKLFPPLQPVPPRTVEALAALWRLEGHLTGMADALRMVEAPHD